MWRSLAMRSASPRLSDNGASARPGDEVKRVNKTAPSKIFFQKTGNERRVDTRNSFHIGKEVSIFLCGVVFQQEELGIHRLGAGSQALVMSVGLQEARLLIVAQHDRQNGIRQVVPQTLFQDGT